MSRFKCTSCPAHKKCIGPIGSELVGKQPVDIVLIGEAPGRDEEIQGRPFVGRSGELLRPTVEAITKNYVLINSRCCFSEHKPKPAELEKCRKNWLKIVLKYKPKIIVCLGEYAAKTVMGKKVKIKNVVGQVNTFQYESYKAILLVNYHPAYMLRMNNSDTKTAQKAEGIWLETWDRVSDYLKGGLPKLPKIRKLIEPEEICAYLKAMGDYHKNFAYDYETWGDIDALRPELNNEFNILCVGLSSEIETVAFPLEHEKVQGDWPLLKMAWRRFLFDGERKSIAQNARYEHKCNIKVFGQTHDLADTMLQMSLVDENAEANLTAISEYCDIPWAWYKKHMQGIQNNPVEAEIGDLLHYCGLDALACRLCYNYLKKLIVKEDLGEALKLAENYAKHLAFVEMTGMAIDGAVISEVGPELKAKSADIKSRFKKYKAVRNTEEWAAEELKNWEKTDKQFNPKSGPQMRHLCIDELHLPVDPDWKGSYDLGKKKLQKFRDKYPLVDLILEYRSTESILKNFVANWQQYTGPDQCIHTVYNQDVVVTGRLSSSKINLQNIPRDNIVRKSLVSRFKQGELLNADFRQLEPMLLAGISGDQGMIKAFAEDFDLHLYVASQIYDMDFEELKALYDAEDEDAKKKRFHGKQMNLGTMYGITEYGLSDYTGLGLEESKELIARYNERFPGVSNWRNEVCKAAIRDGYVRDLFGRIRHLPHARSSDKWEQNRALRQAGNFPIQSTGNHFCLISLCLCRDLIAERNLRAVVTSTTHDSLSVDYDREWRDEIIETVPEAMLIHNEMDYWKPMGVELKVDLSRGTNLYEMENI